MRNENVVISVNAVNVTQTVFSHQLLVKDKTLAGYIEPIRYSRPNLRGNGDKSDENETANFRYWCFAAVIGTTTAAILAA